MTTQSSQCTCQVSANVNANTQEPPLTYVPKGTRNRLTKKQLWFLKEIFETGIPVTDTVRNLRIRPGTLDRWLNSPLFLNRLRTYLNQYYLQTRMELARSAPLAVSGLSFLSSKTVRHGELRKACNDILKLHGDLVKLSTCQGGVPRRGEGVKQAPHGALSAQVGVLLEHVGVISDNNGVLPDTNRTTNPPQNRLLSTENAETTNISQKSA